jgi:hypothetical protein
MEISVHDTADAAFEYIDAFAAKAVSTGAPSDVIPKNVGSLK